MFRNMIAILLLALASKLPAAAPDISKLVQETQGISQDGNRISLVWWIPSEYWAVTLATDRNLSAAELREVVTLLEDYLMLSVIKGSITPVGVIGLSRDELLELLSFSVDGEQLEPIPEDELHQGMQSLLAVMKPVFGQMMGQMGQATELIVFPGRNAAGERLADPLKPGMVSVQLEDYSINFRLPLGSLLPARFDASTGEKFPGNYIYSPFSGKALSTEQPD